MQLNAVRYDSGTTPPFGACSKSTAKNAETTVPPFSNHFKNTSAYDEQGCTLVGRKLNLIA